MSIIVSPISKPMGVIGQAASLSELERFVAKLSNTQVAEVWKAFMMCCEISDDDLTDLSLDRKTGAFSLTLRRPVRGHAPAVTDEAPAGTVILLGETPSAPGGRVVSGYVDALGLSFDEGCALFVKTNIERLSWANYLVLKMVLLLPRMVGDPILAATGTVVDRETGTIETHLRIGHIEVDGDTVNQQYHLYNDSRDVPVKKYPRDRLLERWSSGRAITQPDYQTYLREAYHAAE